MYSFRSIWPYVLILFKDDGHVTLLNCQTFEKKKLTGSFSRIKANIKNYVISGRKLKTIDEFIKSSGDKVFGSNLRSSKPNIWMKSLLEKDKCINQGLNYHKESTYLRLIEVMMEKRTLRLDYVQAVNYPSNVFSRTKYLDKIKNSLKIAFIGDDDFISVFLRKDHDVTVFDLDQELLRILKRENVNAICLDLKKPLPEIYKDSFDVVFCDPPYSYNWINLFLCRALFIVKPGGIISIACYQRGESILYELAKKYSLDLIYRESILTSYISIVHGSMDYQSHQYYFMRSHDVANPFDINEVFSEGLELEEVLHDE